MECLRMKSFHNLLNALFGLALLGTLIAGAYVALRWIGHLLIGLDTQVASVIYAAVAAVLCSAVTLSLIVRSGEQQRSLESLRGQKADSYRRFLTAWSHTLSQAANLDGQNAPHWEDTLYAAEQQLLLWGSNSVVKHYAAYRQQETPHDSRDSAVKPLIEKILQEIRRDLGQSNVGIQTGDLFNLLVDTTRHDDSMNTTVQRTRTTHRLFNSVGYQGAE